MTDNNHQITPPPELVREWTKTCSPYEVPADYIATQAARWGADQELDACCEWIGSEGLAGYTSRELRAARRLKPLNLKKQALLLCDDYIDPEGIIRRALEQLND